MERSLLKNAEFGRIKVAQVAGTSDVITSDAVDMQGFEHALFIVTLGAVTSTGTIALKLQQSEDNASADDYSDLEGSALSNVGDASSNKVLIIEALNTQKRWLKLVAARATAAIAVDSIQVIKFGSKKSPVDQPASVDGSLQLVGPVEGTA